MLRIGDILDRSCVDSSHCEHGRVSHGHQTEVIEMNECKVLISTYFNNINMLFLKEGAVRAALRM